MSYEQQLAEYWKNWRPTPRKPVEQFYWSAPHQAWDVPGVFMAGETLVRSSDYGALAAELELTYGELERIKGVLRSIV